MLTGKLVRLRRWDPTDIDLALKWMNDPEVTYWLASRYPISRPEEEAWLQRASNRKPGDEIGFAIETLAEGRHIGSTGLHEWKPENRTAVLGIQIGEKEFWSRGYGTDAMLTLLRFGFDEMNLNRVSLIVLAENARGIAAYRKCGFVEEGRLRQEWYQRGAYHDLLVMGVLADEFRALHPVEAAS